jgi:hypothetical protein
MSKIAKAVGAALAAAAATGTIAALSVAAPAMAGVDGTAAAAKTFKNCTALNRVYPHGVGRVGARDKTTGEPVRNFKRSNLLYRQNKKSDRDKDGIACEKS